jgi:hypothetical protein
MRLRVTLACFLSACLFPDVAVLQGDASSDAATDASVDAPPTDAGADSVIAHFCASQSPAPAFCDDFDDGGALLSDGGAYPPWGYGSATYDSAVELDTTKVLSPPYAMRSETMPQTAPYTYPAAYVTKFIPSGVTRVTLGVDVYIAQIDPSGGTTIFTLIVADASLPLVVATPTGDAHVIEGYDAPDGAGQYPQLGSSFTLVTKQWMRLVYAIDFAANTVGLTMDSGSGPVAMLPATHSANPFSSNSPAAYIGIYYSQATSTGSTVYYDNVTLDWN